MPRLFYVSKDSNKYFSILESLIDKEYNIKLYIDTTSMKDEIKTDGVLAKITSYGLKKSDILDSCIYNRVNYDSELDEIKLSECFNTIERVIVNIRKKSVEEIDQYWLFKIIKNSDFYGENYDSFDDETVIKLAFNKKEIASYQFITLYKYAYNNDDSSRYFGGNFIAGLKDDICFFKVCHCINDMSYIEKLEIDSDAKYEGYICLELSNFNMASYKFIVNSDGNRISYLISNQGENLLISHDSSEVTVYDNLYDLFKDVDDFNHNGFIE